jgi:hypothetical protein
LSFPSKALALRDLAAKTLDGTVPTLARIRRMSDQAITMSAEVGRRSAQRRNLLLPLFLPLPSPLR